ncbi:hypothetical protein [Haliangium sp.]|uniref:hypothetical protein n=1 Tax=Haliangium sp. TaxID=2663208 RepID=UPI003D0C5EA2
MPDPVPSIVAVVVVAVVVLGAACVDEGISLTPVVDVPPATAAAYPYEGIDELELSIARAGDDAPLALATAAVGEPLALSGVPFGADLVVHLSGTAAGIEIAYGRTCALDVSPDGPAGSPHLYFSRIVRWGVSEQVSLAAPARTGGHGYALPDGRAVIAGGDQDSIELFDPLATGRVTTLTPRTIPRQGSLLVAFAGGQAIVVGGVDDAGAAVPMGELLDPGAATAGRQRETFDGPALVGHAGVSLVDDSLIVAGGEDPDAPAGAAVTGEAWLYRLGDGGALEREAVVRTMQSPRSYHTMTRLGNELGADVLVVGGHDDAGQPVASVELYRPLREAFEDVVGAALIVPRWGHAAVRMPGGFVLIIGGVSPDPADPGGGDPVPVSELELYDPVQGSFVAAGALPADAGHTAMAVTPLPDGRVLLTGGLDPTGVAVDTVLIARLDPIDGRVDLSPSDRLSVPRAGHSAVALCDGTILVTGGSDEPAAPAERYNPPSVGRR